METKRKKFHRFFYPFVSGSRTGTITDPELVHQLQTVLRLNIGEQIQLVDDGKQITAMITAMIATQISFVQSDEQQVASEPKRRLTAYIATFRKEPFEWMLEKLTEIGVHAIVPIHTAHTVRFPWKQERFNTILKESAEQSGRGVIPVLLEPMSFEQALAHAKANAENVLFEIGQQPLSGSSAETVGMFIGPEGGWDASEIELAKSANVKIAGLGDLTLRAETAAVIGSYQLLVR